MYILFSVRVRETAGNYVPTVACRFDDVITQHIKKIFEKRKENIKARKKNMQESCVK